MKLFHWKASKMLERYSAGDIIVMAEDVEKARQEARRSLVAWHRENYGWAEVDDEFNGLSVYRDKLERDLAEDPEEVEHAIFIWGSE